MKYKAELCGIPVTVTRYVLTNWCQHRELNLTDNYLQWGGKSPPPSPHQPQHTLAVFVVRHA
ncbi:hypothetical protein J6590_097566, partial [Homalodisca vitripennis]